MAVALFLLYRKRWTQFDPDFAVPQKEESQVEGRNVCVAGVAFLQTRQRQRVTEVSECAHGELSLTGVYKRLRLPPPSGNKSWVEQQTSQPASHLAESVPSLASTKIGPCGLELLEKK